MIDNEHLETLTENYRLALAAYETHGVKTRAGGYDYPEQMVTFMRSLQEEPWVKFDYRPEDIEALLSDVADASLDELRTVLTGVSRAERFSDGYWNSLFEHQKLDPVLKRLYELLG